MRPLLPDATEAARFHRRAIRREPAMGLDDLATPPIQAPWRIYRISHPPDGACRESSLFRGVTPTPGGRFYRTRGLSHRTWPMPRQNRDDAAATRATPIRQPPTVLMSMR